VTRIKICGLTRVEDVELAVELGAYAVGFVLEPSSPRYVGLADVSRLLDSVPPYVTRTAVMGLFQPGPHLASFDAVQAIGARKSELEASQRAIAVYRVGSQDQLPDQEDADAVLLDAYTDGQFGGTGRAVDLVGAKLAMADAIRPVVLAGGLTPETVSGAIKELQPFAVDVSSGVESAPGIKDEALMRAFFLAVKQADDRSSS
jgi:phosphoribosylanthranilate isomerase